MPQQPRAIAVGMFSVWCLVGAQLVAGIALAVKYRPSLEGGYASVVAMRQEPLFKFLTAFHYWASGVGIAIGALTVLAMLWLGWHGWKSRAAWWSMIVLLLALVATQISGNLLPLSAHDVRTAYIESGIAHDTPGFGPAIATTMLGGDSVSQATVERWYFAHRWIFPGLAILASLLGIGYAGREKSFRANWLLVALPLAGAIVAAVATSAPLGPAAGQQDFASSGARPMWYVYPMHSLLTMFQSFGNDLGWVGSAAIPTVVIVLLLALPFFGKKGDGASAGVRIGTLGALVICVFVISRYGSPMQSPFAEGAPGGETAVASDFGPIDPKLAKAGRAIFERENCLECHRLGDEGSGRKAPNLRGIGSKHSDPKWFMEMLHDPASKDRARMPAFDNLNRSELRQIAEFLRSQTR